MTAYQLKTETITVNHVDFLIRSLLDRQQYADPQQLAAALGISSATWPLFGVVWPSARVLASRVSRLVLEGKRVLEIGCGLALSSLVLHRQGVDITASDYHPLAQDFLGDNARGNNMSPVKFQTGNWETANPLLGEFDVIIGSDVLYEPDHAASVSRFIDCHASDEVEVMIVDPNRGNRARFSKHMLALGYEHEFERFAVAEPEAARCKGRVLHYRR